MTKRLLLSLMLPAFLAAQMPTPAPEPPAPRKPFGTLRVHVQDPKGSPLAGAQVLIPSLNRSHETGETGDVVLGWVPAGKHEVKVSRGGYKPSAGTATVPANGIAVLTVRLEAEAR